CLRTAPSTTPIPPMRAAWTASGACTSGSTAPPGGATRRVSGGAATTSTTRDEPNHGCRWRSRGTGDLAAHGFRASFPASLLRRLRAVVRRQLGGDDRLVRVHVGDGRDADARRLGDVDGVDAVARTDLARRRGVVPRHVGRDDGSHDAAILGADAVALPPGRRPDRRHGLRLGLHCSHCCAALMVILLVIGVMDLRAMAVVAAAITLERLAPAGERVAGAIGAVVVGAGLTLIARAAGLG